ncbi:hypothetical protein JOQ06_029108 [Pogonophryne albipinna]|uniref:Uncharacterized protein n=1 Tax=Pogonophryne albipinna TaxID=1090488 RepID=A0AAD6B7T7_9TELE|nr:hypothetical protein JOQ06_029108 [Pogonophryne albipinna]
MEREVVLWAVVLFPNGGAATVLASWFSLKEDSLEKAKRYEEKPNPVYMESDGESETSRVKRRFAKPPDVHCPTVLPESSQYPSVPTPNASSASGGSHSEDVLSIHQADNGFCGSYLAELDQSMDHCNDGLPTYNSSPYHAMPLEKARNDGAEC